MRQNSIASINALLTACFCLIANPAFSQDSNPPSPQDQAEATQIEKEPDQALFYAFLAEDPQALSGPLFQMLQDKPVLKEWISPHNKMERRYRPLLQWRRWADQRQRFFPALLFCNFICFLSWYLLPKLLQSASQESRQNFWKSVGTGILLAAVTILLTRSVFFTQLGWPLGIVLAGASQAAMLVGLSVGIYNLGHSVSLILRLDKISLLANRAAAQRYCDIFTGSLLAALLLQIPAIGLLPQPGTRFLALFALLGVGAIFRDLRKRSETQG